MNILESLERTFRIESEAIQQTYADLDCAEFERAINLLLASKGRIIVTGIGKSGHIARKLASTLTSTGSPALFLHPAEAAHGDIGMIHASDAVIMLSKSGTSDELIALLPALGRVGVPIILITATPDAALASAAKNSGGAVLCISVTDEACPNDLAPTASTTASLVLGDAIAIALLEARGFSSNDFAMLHPGGAIGRRLTFAVSDVMAAGSDVPSVTPESSFTEVLSEISSKRFGATAVVDQHSRVCGIITDGDIRRMLQTNPSSVASVSAKDIMTASPQTITSDLLAIEAMRKMELGQAKVMQLLVIDADGKLIGILHLHDLVKAGIA